MSNAHGESFHRGELFVGLTNEQQAKEAMRFGLDVTGLIGDQIVGRFGKLFDSSPRYEPTKFWH